MPRWQHCRSCSDTALAACAVAHDSARIGEASSTLTDGVVSHVKVLGQGLGVSVGERCDIVISRLKNHV